MWNQNNTKVVTWIANSIEPQIAISLQSFTKAFEKWNHIKKLYHQTRAIKFYPDTELAKYCQGDKSVEEFYTGFLTLWNEKDSMILAFVPSESASHVLSVQQEAQISQFHINLMPEFESVRADLMNREIPAHSDT